MLADMNALRETEINYINDYIKTLGEQYGESVETNAGLTRIVQEILIKRRNHPDLSAHSLLSYQDNDPDMKLKKNLLAAFKEIQ